MSKGPFLPSEFTATEFSTQADKAAFGNTLLHFIDSAFKRTLFTRKFYQRLSMTYGHIAHYSLTGFWEEWFAEDADRVRFLEHLLRWPCHGDPAFTFSDVERALQQEVRRKGYLSRYQSIADATLRAGEVAMLEQLEAKYRRPGGAEHPVFREYIGAARDVKPIAPPHVEPIQGTLF